MTDEQLAELDDRLRRLRWRGRVASAADLTPALLLLAVGIILSGMWADWISWLTL